MRPKNADSEIKSQSLRYKRRMHIKREERRHGNPLIHCALPLKELSEEAHEGATAIRHGHSKSDSTKKGHAHPSGGLPRRVLLALQLG